jgi:hypothetical protein
MVEAMNRLWICAALAATIVNAQAPMPQPQPPAPAPQASAPQPAPAAVKPASPVPEPARPPLQPAQVQTVYFLPMASHLDQYLASQIVRRGLYQVTMDPAKADAIFSDSIGRGLEIQLEQLYPPPAPPPAPIDELPPDEQDAQKKAEREREQAKQDADWKATRSTFSRGRGNVFLVDRYSRAVIWSIYRPAKNSSAGEVNKASEKIAETLAKQVKGQ